VNTNNIAGQIQVRILGPDDFPNLHNYLEQLSAETRLRFGPHPFDLASIIDLYASPDHYRGYIAIDISTGIIVAYSILKKGILAHDRERLQSYGLVLNNNTDYTFAPSVTDAWQGKGVGQLVFRYICSELRLLGAGRIILWGGVQCHNQRAVHYYLKNDFRILGQFEYNGCNYDMIREIL
jgi:diamine N-acetyltransferase